MVTFTEEKPNLYLALKHTAYGGNYSYERVSARNLLNGLNATFRKFGVQPAQQEIIAEAVLRWRVLKDVGTPKASDLATKRLFLYDDFLTEWLHTNNSENEKDLVSCVPSST